LNGRTTAVAVLVVVIVVAAFVLVYYQAGLNRASSSGLTEASSSSPSQMSGNSVSATTKFVNSTYSFTCAQNATCDFYLPFTMNVTCIGCSFSGAYVSPSPGSRPVEVSGNHTVSYDLSSFDSPFYLAWNISKLSSAGTLEVTIAGSNSVVYYDRTTSAPYGFLTGVWNVEVGTENVQFG